MGCCNVVAILSMADLVSHVAETVKCMSWICKVCLTKLCCEILLHGRLFFM